MAAQSPPNFGLRSDDYAAHRPGFPARFFDRLEALVPIAGTDALDLGTGPGPVALALAERGARVTGIDVSANQVKAAERQARNRGLSGRAAFVVRRAEATGLPASSFDVVTAGQCWVWFDHDQALAEAERLLRPGGHLVVAHYCYLPGRSAVARRTEDLVLEHNPGWTMAGWNGLYPKHIDAMQQGALRLVEQFCFDCAEPFTHEGWRGRMRTCNGVGSGGMTDEQVAAFDAELTSMLRREFPREPLLVEHRVWATVARKPGGAP